VIFAVLDLGVCGWRP